MIFQINNVVTSVKVLLEVLEIFDKFAIIKNKDATKLGMINIGRKILKSRKILPSDYFTSDFNFPFNFHETKNQNCTIQCDLFQKMTVIILHTQRRNN